MFSSKINVRDLFVKKYHLFMFKAFRCPENTDKVLFVHFFSQVRPQITKWLMVDEKQ